MRYQRLLVLWLLTDLLVFILAYIVAYFMRVGFIFSTDFPFENYVLVAALTAPVWLTSLITTRSFALTRNQTSLRNGAYILYSCAVGTAVFALGYYFIFGLFFSRKLLLYALILSVAFVWEWHVLFQKFLRWQLRRNPPAFPTLIVGVTRESKALVERLQNSNHPLMPVAILDGRGCKEKEIHGVPVRGKLNKLEEVLSEGVTHLIQCSDLEQSLNLLSACRQRGLSYILLPSVLGIVERDERVDTLEGQPVTIVSQHDKGLMWFFR